MKQENIPKYISQAVKLIPIKQSDLWRQLHISKQDCSELVKTLIDKKLIERKKVSASGITTFLLYKKRSSLMKKYKNKEDISVKSVKTVSEMNPEMFSGLLNDKGKFNPCTGCANQCNPKMCPELIDWIEN